MKLASIDKWERTRRIPSPPSEVVFHTLNARFYVLHFMPNPTVQQQQQQYYSEQRIVNSQNLCLVSDQISQKRWEFQQTDFDPSRLWNIANQVEALNWVSKKLNRILIQNKPVPDSSVKSLIGSLIKVLVRIDKCLSKFKTNKHKSYENSRLKSRATIIEWSLFQIHFVSADVFR